MIYRDKMIRVTTEHNMLHVGFAETDITPKLGSQSPAGCRYDG